MDITLIRGLPGTGKTRLARKLANITLISENFFYGDQEFAARMDLAFTRHAFAAYCKTVDTSDCSAVVIEGILGPLPFLVEAIQGVKTEKPPVIQVIEMEQNYADSELIERSTLKGLTAYHMLEIRENYAPYDETVKAMLVDMRKKRHSIEAGLFSPGRLLSSRDRRIADVARQVPEKIPYPSSAQINHQLKTV